MVNMTLRINNKEDLCELFQASALIVDSLAGLWWLPVQPK